MTHRVRLHLTYARMIVLGFLTIVLLGGILLSLPIASKAGVWTPFGNALFTSVSATCVTGLVVYDTYTYWSLFGQIVILLLIQIGGLGFMTMFCSLSIILKRRISISERRLMMQSTGTMQIGGMVRMVRHIVIGTACIEGLGAIFLATRFCPILGVGRGIYYAIFHSVSAFCNAGFDLMGTFETFSSLTLFSADVVVNVVIMLLIVIGGVGFWVWEEIWYKGIHFRRYDLHAKLVLCTTAVLIFGGALLFFIFEYDHSMKGMPLGHQILASFFQSVTPRTAGFNTVSLSQLSGAGILLMTALMLIGGSPGSTAGGIKTTTFTTGILGVLAAARQDNSVNVFRRRIDNNTVRQAFAISTVYLLALVLGTMAICSMESFSLQSVLFEVASAAGTVGLTVGITPMLGLGSKIILMVLMFGGRIGGLSLMLAVAQRQNVVPINRPAEKIMIG